MNAQFLDPTADYHTIQTLTHAPYVIETRPSSTRTMFAIAPVQTRRVTRIMRREEYCLEASLVHNDPDPEFLNHFIHTVLDIAPLRASTMIRNVSED
jgi:hypothetical protein